MSNTIKFIDTVIRNLTPPTERKTFWCYGCPGFGLRVTPKGVKTFVFKYTVKLENQKRVSRWVSIGKYPEWSIRRARNEYDHIYEQVHQYGQDPVQDKKNDKNKLPDNILVSDFAKIYLDQAKIKEKAFAKEEEKYFYRDIFPVIGNKGLNEVNGNDIDIIQNNIIKRAQAKSNATQNGKVAVRHALACVKRLFDLAIKKQIIQQNPVSLIDSLGKNGKRTRVMNFQEIWLFWNRVENVGIPPITALALKFELVTMQRSIEIRNMRHNALRPLEGVWHMEMTDTKSKRMHRVPLNKHALAIIESASQYTGKCAYVFGATRATKPPRTLNDSLAPLGKSALPQALRNNLANIGIKDVKPHDLRRTGATWITAAGLPKLYARLMLNHSDGENDVTGEVYVQYSYDFEKQHAAKVWEFVLDQIVTCPTIEDIPTLEEIRRRVQQSGLLRST